MVIATQYRDLSSSPNPRRPWRLIPRGQCEGKMQILKLNCDWEVLDSRFGSKRLILPQGSCRSFHLLPESTLRHTETNMKLLHRNSLNTTWLVFDSFISIRSEVSWIVLQKRRLPPWKVDLFLFAFSAACHHPGNRYN